jgi:hypothetical protein
MELVDHVAQGRAGYGDVAGRIRARYRAGLDFGHMRCGAQPNPKRMADTLEARAKVFVVTGRTRALRFYSAVNWTYGNSL